MSEYFHSPPSSRSPSPSLHRHSTTLPGRGLLSPTPSNSSTSSSKRRSYFLSSKAELSVFLRHLFSAQYLPIWILVALSVFGAIFFFTFHKQIVEFMTAFAKYITDKGPSGMFFMTFFLWLSCFPPLIGFGSLLYLCGFIYGFPLGFVPAYIGALSGACSSFSLARWWMGDYYRARILNWYPKFKNIEDAVDKGGLKLTTMIRLAPYPFGIMSVLFSMTSVTFTRYTQATALALLKIILHIYIGSSVRDLAEMSNFTPARVAALVFGMLIATVVFVYLTVLVRRALKEAHIVGDEGEEVPLNREGSVDDEDLEVELGNLSTDGFPPVEGSEPGKMNIITSRTSSRRTSIDGHDGESVEIMSSGDKSKSHSGKQNHLRRNSFSRHSNTSTIHTSGWESSGSSHSHSRKNSRSSKPEPPAMTSRTLSDQSASRPPLAPTHIYQNSTQYIQDTILESPASSFKALPYMTPPASEKFTMKDNSDSRSVKSFR
ncbi:hypothetical protein DFS34DRAFT_513156 [Phlyctochytrium arcticum]|nr:hypothetical protein DFS34DRAFT_513156 [Phlyctochytrium arcticum]